MIEAQESERRLILSTSTGTLTVNAEEQANQNSTLRLKLKGEAFPSGLKPFLKINRTQEMMGGALSKTIVFKTEVVTKYANKAPSWAVFEVNVSTLCQVRLDLPNK